MVKELSNQTAQGRMFAICEKLNGRKPKDFALNEIAFDLTEAPAVIRERISHSPLGQALLNEGESLSVQEVDERFPDIRLSAGSAALRASSLVVYKSSWPRVLQQAGKYVKNGEEDSLYKLGLSFAYADNGQWATEEVKLETVTTREEPPRLYRNVFALAYAETGYEGHNRQSYTLDEVAALGAIATIEAIIEAETSGNS